MLAEDAELGLDSASTSRSPSPTTPIDPAAGDQTIELAKQDSVPETDNTSDHTLSDGVQTLRVSDDIGESTTDLPTSQTPRRKGRTLGSSGRASRQRTPSPPAGMHGENELPSKDESDAPTIPTDDATTAPQMTKREKRRAKEAAKKAATATLSPKAEVCLCPAVVKFGGV